MKATKWMWIVAGVLAIALIYPLARKAGSAGEGAKGSSSGEADPAAKTPRGGSGPVSGGDNPSTKGDRTGSVRAVPEVPEGDLESPVYLASGQELAKVNGVVISLKDLMALPSSEGVTEQVMTKGRYQFLLNRAVERELTFQAAKAQGVTLNQNQEKALAEAAARRRNAYEGKKVFDDLGDAPENAAFQQRDFEGLLLQASLVERAGVPSSNVGPEEVQAYYEANRGKYGNLPSDPVARQAAWAKLESEIRATLAPLVRQQYQEELAAYMQELKDEADITIAAP